MTTPTTSKSAAKSTAAKVLPAKADEKPATVVEENVTDSDRVVETEPTPVERIPAGISSQAILKEFAQRYLDVFDEISEYNKAVLAEKSSEWNAAKVLEKARELASPDDASKLNKEVKDALDAWEKLASATILARKNVLEVTSKAAGITLSAVADRDPAVEGPLKEKRKFAIEIGTQLSLIAKMTTDENASAAVTEFLATNAMPAIGRDQVRTFGDEGTSTPKYRVTVTITKGDETVFSADGFTKTALGITNLYERGKAPKADKLRAAWESAGNTPEKTVQSPVEFDDNGLHFTITKK